MRGRDDKKKRQPQREPQPRDKQQQQQAGAVEKLLKLLSGAKYDKRSD